MLSVDVQIQLAWQFKVCLILNLNTFLAKQFPNLHCGPDRTGCRSLAGVFFQKDRRTSYYAPIIPL